MSELLPCPLCNQPPMDYINDQNFCQINCSNDDCKSDFAAEHRIEQIAIVRWNRYAKEAKS